MSKVNGYNVYQSSYYSSAVQNTRGQDKTRKSDTAQKTDSTGKTQRSTVQLSDKAKALLEELKKQYSNMDFIVTDYDSDEEAASCMSRSVKEYTVLIDAEELERMAADEEVKNQNLALLDEAVGKLDDLKEQLKDSENGDQVVQLGVTIGKDGEISFFAELEKVSERQKEFIDKIRAEKKEAAEETRDTDTGNVSAAIQDKYLYEKGKRTTVYADSTEELLEKIAGIDWSSVKEETAANMPGGHFDFSI